MKKYFVIDFILFLIGIPIILSQECIRPQICVPLKHCSSVNKMLYEEKLDDNQMNHFKNLQCGFRKGLVYVCCNSSLPTPEVCSNYKNGNLDENYRIYSGTETSIGDYPWAVLIGKRWRDNDGSTGIMDICGGSLINERYILTAAHCVIFLNKIEHLIAIESVKLGEWNRTSDPDEFNGIKVYIQNVEVETIIPHKKYNFFKKYNDIALLRLKDKINFTDFVHPICLPSINQNFSENLTVIGWGFTEHSGGKLTDVLREADVNFVSNEECSKSHKSIKLTQLCAGSEGSDSCNGDSGGSLIGYNIREKYLAGIVSYGGKRCGIKGFPGVYTDVRKYINWIEQTIIH